MKNTCTKILVLAFALFSTVQSFAIHQIDGNWEEYGLTSEYDGYYVIATAQDLEEFRDMVNSGQTSINAVLTADIVLNEYVLDENGDLRGDFSIAVTDKWSIPISDYTISTYYSGTFDGNLHTISGLFVSGLYYIGLFGCLDGATVKNLTIEDSFFHGQSFVGGICGDIPNNVATYIQNCSVNAYVNSDLESVGGIYGGGSNSRTSTISNCINKGKICGAGNYVGGICSRWTGTIIDCKNSGYITGTGEYTGGIVGDKQNNGDVENCCNTGDVEGVLYVGGIAGNSTAKILKSCNFGKIKGDSHVGGVCGIVAGTTLEYVFNVGPVSAENGYVGGLVGGATTSYCRLNYSYNAATVSNNSSYETTGSICGYFNGTDTYLLGCSYDSDVSKIKACGNMDYSGGMNTNKYISNASYNYQNENIWIKGEEIITDSIIKIDDEFGYKIIGTYPYLKDIIDSPVPYAKQLYYNTGTASDPNWITFIPIYTPEDLALMENSSKTFVLMNDIIGYSIYTSISLFYGKLYGRGKTISGLNTSNQTESKKGGLFEEVRNAYITDVNIESCKFNAKSGYNDPGSIGSIAGIASGTTTITNCRNYCGIYISSSYTSYAGGIVGSISDYQNKQEVTIQQCFNYGYISGDYSGGIVGYCPLTKAQICLNVVFCENNGEVGSRYYQDKYAGGIVGCMSGKSNDSKGIIKQCVNNGVVCGSDASGGIVAIGGGITNCLNSGNVGSRSCVGGIVGRGGDTVTYSLNVGTVLLSNPKTGAVGGAICGQATNLYVDNCYYNMDSCSLRAISNLSVNSVSGVTTSELVSGMLPPNFDSEYWGVRQPSIKDMKKYYFYPYLKCFGEESALVVQVKECHPVSFVLNGGTSIDELITLYVEDEETPLPTDVEKEGCTFAGWYDNSNYTSSAFTEIPLTETQPKTFYAKWIANNYDITYELGGGTINSGKNTSYTYGYGVLLPTDVTRTGYTFKGWYDNPNFDGESVLSIPANATGNKTYYAHWVVNTYHVTFFAYEGVMNTDIDSYTFGKTTVLPTEVTKSGYDFAGWYTNDSYSGVAIQSIASNETGDKTYYAKWNKKSYSVSVTFDRAIGNVSGIDSYLHGDNAVLKAHADAGYEFAFWSCADETVLEGKNVQDSTLTFVVTSPTELSATFKFKEIVYPAAEFVIGTLKTGTEIAPIDLATLFESSEGGEVTYMVTSSSPNVLLPQIENGKLYLSTMGLQGKATITVTAKLANGNKSSLSAEAIVEYNCNIHVVPTIVNASCYGFSDGSISLAAENDYSYQWIGEEVTTNKIENIKAGNYSVQITDERGCKSLETYTVSQPDEISVAIADVVNPRCGVQSEIRLNAVGEYTYLWSNGSTEKDLVGAGIGEYSVVVTNPETGCSTTLSQTLELTFQKPEISLVTVSRETGKNLIVWVRANTDQISYYTIYREGAQSKKYSAIGTVNYSEISVFQDDVAKPMTRQWSYKISATDVCGNETELSDAHTTLHLNEMESMHEGMAELIWQPYEGLDYNSFYIVRETKVNNYTFVDTVTTVPSTLTSYTAEIPPVGKSIFYVGIKLDKVIDPKQFLKAESGPFSLALSNIAEAENNNEQNAVESLGNNAEVYAISHTIYVSNAAGVETIVYDIHGQKIAAAKEQDYYEFPVKTDGVYFVRVGGMSFKVVIQ
ncbi:MAG: InlB B-repeat-containing protein [Bacteroidales bacterium]|nr:InlB B-repeat-containing protein [Bacteroidales bacterium]